MDQVLAQIYAQIFVGYNTRGLTLLDQIKDSLLRNQQSTFRPDALLCVLSLYDQMIIVPYSERLKLGPLFSSVNGSSLTAQDFDARVMDSFYLLVQTIQKNKGETLASSHDVIKAIDFAWGSLSSYFNWG